LPKLVRLFLAETTASWLMHCRGRRFHSANTLTNISGSIDIRISNTAPFNAALSSKNRSSSQCLKYPNRQKSPGARSGLSGAWNGFLIPNLLYLSEVMWHCALSTWRTVPFGFSFGRLRALPSTILGRIVPAKRLCWSFAS
jgi:hypothetical protein